MIDRKPFDLREAHIIRRMKNVLKLSVKKIATVVERNKTSVYKALDPYFEPEKRGRHNLLREKDADKLARAISFLDVDYCLLYPSPPARE